MILEMEKKGLRKKDILRMDGLLPPTRRLPVCDAVSGTSDKKKDKKWSIGGILRRISSIKDYDSSSNDEEIVYCKKTPRKPTKFNRQPDGVVLHSIENNSEQDKRRRIENNGRHSTDSPSHLHRESLHSRSSDGSLDGLGKKSRKNKLKARAEAKRDHLCVGSSSDEDCRRSSGSLNRFHGADGSLNGQRGNVCNRKTRTARTERYIKRLSRDEGNGSGDALNDVHGKRFSSEYVENEQQRQQQHGVQQSIEVNGSCRPPVHPRRAFGEYSNSRAFPVHRSSAESLRDARRPPDTEALGSLGDFRRYSTGQYVTDLNQNNTYGKISRNIDNIKDAYADGRPAGNFFTYPAKNVCHYPEPYDYAVDRRLTFNPDILPPAPPPRDPRYRVPGYGYSSYPTTGRQIVPNAYARESDKTSVARPDWRNFRSYGSNNELAWWGKRIEHEYPRDSNPRTEFRNSLESINNKYNSGRHRANESVYRETEAMRCRRRNTRNDELNCNDTAHYGAYKATEKSASICESSKPETAPSYVSAASSDRSSGRSPCERIISRSVTPTRNNVLEQRVEQSRTQCGDNGRTSTPTTEEVLARRRSSRNLEEALSELEAIYNSLRLGDEDLLDRAERRSMEEFSLKQGKCELDATAAAAIAPDSPDRTKDDMAYRRMHPKERPTSVSDVAGQSTLSNISYLIATPVLSRTDSADELAHTSSIYRRHHHHHQHHHHHHRSSRGDEPDVTRDDVVFRSISRANNTLRIVDPQPPFGIPLGPVTAATESDYLHTTPTKPEQPRSPYIPQCEPDVVTDDLAYRALRKDVGAAARSAAADGRIENGASGEEPSGGACGVTKKRAVRSMSANLYGLINHDRIHLRREPSLDAIRDEIQELAHSCAVTAAERPADYLRRVVSDGELSDNDALRRKEGSAGRGDIDINGNHPAIGAAYRRQQSGSRVSPEVIAITRESRKRRTTKESSVGAGLSNAALSSGAALEDEFWREYLRSEPNVSDVNCGRSTEADFTAYSRLCQDLVNMIRSSDDDAPPSESPSHVRGDDSIVPSSDKPNDFDAKLEIDEPPTSVLRRAPRSSATDHSGAQRAARANGDKRETESESVESSTEPSTDSTRPEAVSTAVNNSNNLDFYLRVADENVKLIAAAFGSVVDHLRDASRPSSYARNKNSSTSRDVSEIENQSGSARSSALYSQTDDATSNDQRRSTVVSPKLEDARRVAPSKRDSLTSDDEGDQSESTSRRSERNVLLTADVELDLSRAVRDLQLAAASLCEHEREIEDLGVRRNGKIDAIAATATTTNGSEEDGPIRKIGFVVDAPRERERKRDREEEEEKEEEAEKMKKITATNADEDSPIRKLSLIADTLRQERERDQEETLVMPTSGLAAAAAATTRSDAREEGERSTVCELVRKSCRYVADAQSCVTNNPAITRATITTCSVLLLACLLALLLAFSPAS